MTTDLYDVRELPGKGKGLVATQKIQKGSRILAEKPILTMPRQGHDLQTVNGMIASQLKQLPKDDQRAFLALQNNFIGSLSPFLGIVRTNALPLGTEAVEGGIFLTASRINHACRPNCQHTWNKGRGKETVHAVRDIAEGEEITIAYTDTLPSARRRDYLRDTFKFECTCDLCSLPEKELRLSDERLVEIQMLDEMIGDGLHLTKEPGQHLQWVHSLVLLLDAEAVADARLPRAYYDAFQTVIAHKDQARAKVFAERAYAARLCCEGEDSESTLHMKELTLESKSHRLFGSSSAWAQGMQKIPRDLEPGDFEKWLWRQKMV